MELVKQLEIRVEECKRSVERAKQELATFQAALDFERRKKPATKRGRRAGKRNDKSENTSASPATEMLLTKTLPFIHAGSENKTNVLRRFIASNPGLYKAAVMAYGNKDIPGNKNFGYTTVAKMLERGEIEIKEGRVYPTEVLTKKLEAAEAAS